jgi:ribose transport system permease protein
MTLTAVTALVLGGVALSGGRGGVTGALLGAVSLWLIGYVLATFNFGAIQAFMTQMIYGLVLVLSLLLTLLVPTIARRVSFVSPGAAFVVLGLVVVGIMMQVATFDTYAATAPVAVEAPLATRYFLIEPVRVATEGGGISRLQALSLVGALAAIAFVVAARLVDADAGARRMGVFHYLFVAVLLVGLFVAVAILPDTQIFGGAR